MAWRDIDGLYAVPGAKDASDLFPFDEERFARSFSQGQAFVDPAEPALGAPYSGYSKAKSKMRGKPQLSGVRDSLPVTEKDIGLLPDCPICLDKGRDFPK